MEIFHSSIIKFILSIVSIYGIHKASHSFLKDQKEPFKFVVSIVMSFFYGLTFFLINR